MKKRGEVEKMGKEEKKGTGIIDGMNKKLGGDKEKNENRSITRYSTLYNATDISGACK